MRPWRRTTSFKSPLGLHTTSLSIKLCQSTRPKSSASSLRMSPSTLTSESRCALHPPPPHLKPTLSNENPKTRTIVAFQNHPLKPLPTSTSPRTITTKTNTVLPSPSRPSDQYPAKTSSLETTLTTRSATAYPLDSILHSRL